MNESSHDVAGKLAQNVTAYDQLLNPSVREHCRAVSTMRERHRKHIYICMITSDAYKQERRRRSKREVQPHKWQT